MARSCFLLKEDPARAKPGVVSLSAQVQWVLLKKNDECLVLHGEMMKCIHLTCSEAFDVQLQDCWTSELVDGVP